MKRKFLLLCGLAAGSLAAFANPVIVRMNAVSTTMSLVEKESGKAVALEAPVNYDYSLELDPGRYILTGYGKDGEKVNGKIELLVTDSLTTQQYTLITCTAYVSNKDAGGKSWNMENGDFSLDVKVNTREGVAVNTVPGESVTAGRYTFLALNGNSYNVAFIPSDVHKEEGYMTLYRGGTLTANVNVTGAIPLGGPFSISVPADAELQLGLKFTHFTDFTPVEPDNVEQSAEGKVFNYTLANGQVYNYRTWTPDGLTQGGYFTMNLDEAKCPHIGFTEADYKAHDPKAINHDVASNNGYETGDIFLNINPEGHLKLDVGDDYLLHAMRTWEISDNSTNNYFFEPDFHYTVLDTGFQPSDNVVQIENADTHNSAWSRLKAVGNGTAIVLVTYDGINLNYYNNADKKDYLGGSYWGAIWPENTGVFVVTVGESSSAKANMVINQQYNVDALRLAGEFVDAEHDVFYYLDSEEGCSYTFTPEGVVDIAMASPVVSESAVSYSGFSKERVSKNDDGSYTVLLPQGRNIVRLTDASGRSVYQILTAKPCHREIVNLTREGSTVFQPGDKFKIQYSGLFHPANKIAGIYNMSAYVTYNGTPNGSSLILGSGQYTFGSAASAQAITVEIPEDYDVEKSPFWVMDEGVIQVNGYGDPIGNHRNTSPLAGRSPNFTAVPHKTYFGAIPDIKIPVSAVKLFDIALNCNVDDAEISLSFADKQLEADDDGHYSGTFGSYDVIAKKAGYRCFRATYSIGEDAEGPQVFDIAMTEGSEGMWDGVSVSEVAADSDGVYHISNGAEMAFFAQAVAAGGKNLTSTFVLDNDIDLGDFDWSPVGDSSKTFSGKFDGRGHTVFGLYIDRLTVNNQALFGYVKGTASDPASISNLTVEGFVCGKQYVGGIVANLNAYASIDRCANLADVRAASSYAGGVVGYISSASSSSVSDCYNRGDVSGTTNVGGIAGYNNASATITNVYSIGEISSDKADTAGACVGATTSKSKVTNAFAVKAYGITDGHILVSGEQMASGEIAFRLGSAFSQAIGEEEYPVFGSLPVLYDEDNDLYYNNATGFEIDLGNGSSSVEVTDDGLIMHVDDSYSLSVTAAPKAARLPALVWSSSNPDVVALDTDDSLNPVITAKGIGEAVIKVSEAENTDVFDTCKVIVSSAASVDSLSGISPDALFDVYDLSGNLVLRNSTVMQAKILLQGVYIFKNDRKALRVML